MVGLGLALALPSGRAAAAPDPEQLLLEAEQHFERGEFRDSARAYAGFYRDLAATDRASALGENAVFKAAEAYRRAHAAAGDPVDLRESQALLQEYLDTLERQTGRRDGPLAEYVTPELQRVTEALAALEASTPAVEVPPQSPEPEPESESESESAREVRSTSSLEQSPEATPQDRPAIDGLGLGLTLGGVALLGTGVGLMVHGGTLEARAQARLDARGGSQPSDAQYLQSARDLRTPLLISGGILAAGGAAAVIVGVVRLSRRRRSREHVRLHPAANGLTLRF